MKWVMRCHDRRIAELAHIGAIGTANVIILDIARQGI